MLVMPWHGAGANPPRLAQMDSTSAVEPSRQVYLGLGVGSGVGLGVGAGAQGSEALFKTTYATPITSATPANNSRLFCVFWFTFPSVLLQSCAMPIGCFAGAAHFRDWFRVAILAFFGCRPAR